MRQVISETDLLVKITVAPDGQQAIHILEVPQFHPDLIILDLNIPKVGGIEILARCKPTAPVVVFTSSSNPAEKQRAEKLGVREFVQKPIDFGEFSTVVQHMVKHWVHPEASGTAEDSRV